MNSGNYYKTRTRVWYRKQGYTTELVEKLQAIRHGGQTIYKKNDLLGADIIAVNDHETILANAVLGKSNIAKHVREFQKYPSGGLKRVVVIWEKGWREPLIRNVDDGVHSAKPKRLKSRKVDNG